MNGPTTVKALGCSGQRSSQEFPPASAGVSSTHTRFAMSQAPCPLLSVVQGTGAGVGAEEEKTLGKFKEVNSDVHRRGMDRFHGIIIISLTPEPNGSVTVPRPPGTKDKCVPVKF